MKFKRILTSLIIIFLLLPIVVIGAPNYGNVGPTTELGFDIKIEDEIVAEGSSADDHETTILFTDPTADRTITIPDSDQTVGTATSIQDNSILEIDLKAVDESADEDILTKEDTTGDFEWHSAAEIKALMSLDLVANLKVKLDATGAPTVNDDVDLGYAVGSRWFDVTNDKEYVCLDNTDGAAVWTETTQAGGGYTNLTEFVEQTAWRLFYSNAAGDVIELALGPDGQYLKSTGATSAPIFDTPTGAGDMLKATYDTDEDGDIDVAAGGTEKSVWTLYAIPYLSGTTVFGEIPIGTAGQVLKVGAGATGYEFANESDPTVDTDAEIKAILVDEVTKTGDFTANRLPEINNSSGIIEQSDIEHKANGGYDFNANSAGFTTQTATGDGATTCDWRIGLKFRFLFGAQNETFTFTNPEFSCHLQIIMIQDATGSRAATWPAGIYWANGTDLVLSTGANARDIVNFFFDDYDDIYYGMGTDFAIP